MKREDVKKILPEITDEQLGSIMKLHGDSVTAYKSEIEGLKGEIEVKSGTIKEKLKKIAELENVDIEKLKQDEYERGKNEANAEIEKLKFSQAIDTELTKAGAKNVKALKALLDMDNIKLENDALSGLTEQIEKIKTENGFLFNDGNGKPNFTSGSTGSGTELTKEAFQKMGYLERLNFKKENPEAYEEMTKQ